MPARLANQSPVWENGHGTEFVIDNAIGAAMLFFGHFDKLITTLTFLDRDSYATKRPRKVQAWFIARITDGFPSLRESEANIPFFLVNLSNRCRQLVRGV